MKRSKHYTLIVFVGWFMLGLPIPGLAMTPLSMTFDRDEDGEAIVVGDLEPGAELVVFTVSRSVRAFVPTTESSADLYDADQDGEVRIHLGEAVPAKFIAVAVELGSGGRFAVLTPQDSPAREIALPSDSFGQGPGRRFDRLQDHSDLVSMLLVRPGDGGGAWTLVTGDGAAADESPSSDGLVWTSASSMQPVGESGPAPDEYQKDDLLIRIAPRVGEYFIARIVR